MYIYIYMCIKDLRPPKGSKYGSRQKLAQFLHWGPRGVLTLMFGPYDKYVSSVTLFKPKVLFVHHRNTLLERLQSLSRHSEIPGSHSSYFLCMDPILNAF